ncbi:TIGR00270 family protein [Candidatus Bathyarchaeota archaeon]|nr:MAG: TIGR00270 family protein [Candidatus Bathyarchaeota archaeon]
MRCEVCGRRIRGKPHKVIIEGAKMVVCGRCASLGTPYYEPKKPSITVRRTMTTTGLSLASRKTVSRTMPKIDESLELVEDYSVKVRQAREKLGLSHEDLGKKIGEKVSVLRKVETGKIVPDNILARKLEHALQIKLLVPASSVEVEVPKKEVLASKSPKELTLGDIAQIKTKKTEGSLERKQ